MIGTRPGRAALIVAAAVAAAHAGGTGAGAPPPAPTRSCSAVARPNRRCGRRIPRPRSPTPTGATATSRSRSGPAHGGGVPVAPRRCHRQRAEGDAVGGVPRSPVGTRPAADPRRHRVAGPDDPPVRQHRGHPRRGDRRGPTAGGAGPPGRHAQLQVCVHLGALADQRRRPGAVLPAHRFVHRPDAPRLGAGTAGLDHPRPALGHRACRSPGGRCTSRAGGIRDRTCRQSGRPAGAWLDGCRCGDDQAYDTTPTANRRCTGSWRACWPTCRATRRRPAPANRVRRLVVRAGENPTNRGLRRQVPVYVGFSACTWSTGPRSRPDGGRVGSTVDHGRNMLRRIMIAATSLAAVFALAGMATAAPVRAAACGTPTGPNRIRCTALTVHRPLQRAVTTPDGYGPAQLRAAYGVASVAAVKPTTTRPSGSSTRTAIRTWPPISPPTAATSACRPARWPPDACGSSGRPARRACRPPARPGAWRPRSMRTWSRDAPAVPHRRRRGVRRAFADLGAAENEAVKLGAHAGEQQLGRRGLHTRSEL